MKCPDCKSEISDAIKCRCGWHASSVPEVKEPVRAGYHRMTQEQISQEQRSLAEMGHYDALKPQYRPEWAKHRPYVTKRARIRTAGDDDEEIT